MNQIVLNAFISASWIAVTGLGFGLIFYCARFFHLAHGAVFTTGAYLTFLFNVLLGVPLLISIALAVALSGLLGWLMHIAVYRPLRQRGASSLVLLIASLGMYVALQNSIAMAFGKETKTIRAGVVEEGIDVLGGRLTSTQILTMCASVILVAAVAGLLGKTRIGRAMRAVASDPELASISGIDCDRIIAYAFAAGSALAGLAGVLVALDVDMTPTMGMHALMMGVVAVIVGGRGSVPGVAFAALLIGMAQHLGVWKISSQWQDAIAFIILLAFLLLRPQGFLGTSIRRLAI